MSNVEKQPNEGKTTSKPIEGPDEDYR